MIDQNRTQEYYNGVIDALHHYAWWKDGVQYVGTSGTTLVEATNRVYKQMEDTLQKQEKDYKF